MAGGINAVRGGVKEVRKYALKSMCSVGVMSGVIGVVTELGLFVLNYCEAQRKYEVELEHAHDHAARERCEQHRNRNITEAFCEGAGGFIGSIAGAVIGSIIPVIGTTIGAQFSGYGGRWIGKMFGRFFGKIWFKCDLY